MLVIMKSLSQLKRICIKFVIVGKPMQKDSRNSLLKKIYGQNIGLVQNSKPIMIENPEFLKLTQNGDDSSGQGVETESDILNSGNKVKEFIVSFCL